jgi:hypothetical protein
MNGPLPALVYVDVACELYPELAPKIRDGVAEFYSDPSERCGEYLVQKGILTDEQNRLVLLAQKAQRGLLETADQEELVHIQSAVHLRTMASIEEMGLLIRRLKT